MGQVTQIDIVAIFEKASGHKIQKPKPYAAGRPPRQKPKTEVKQNAPRTAPHTTPDME